MSEESDKEQKVFWKFSWKFYHDEAFIDAVRKYKYSGGTITNICAEAARIVCEKERPKNMLGFPIPQTLEELEKSTRKRRKKK